MSKEHKKKKHEASANDIGRRGVGLFQSSPAHSKSSRNLDPFDLKKTRTRSDVVEVCDSKSESKTNKLEEGGPGSGKSYDNTMPIGMPLGEVTIGKRSGFMKGKKPLNASIKMCDIKKVGQEKYVPTKMSRMVSSWDKVKDKPVDLLKINDKEYQVLDGHHRFLSAKSLGEKSIKANVYESSKLNEKSMLLIPGEWEVVSNGSDKGKKGQFRVDNLGVIFWKSGESEMFINMSQTDKFQNQKTTQLELKSGRTNYKFKRVK